VFSLFPSNLRDCGEYVSNAGSSSLHAVSVIYLSVPCFFVNIELVREI
jgi:hypothetical protein